MLSINKKKVASFARRYLLVFALAVGGWELSQFANGKTDFGVHDLFEAFALFIGLFLSVVLLVSFFQGWIEFESNDQ